MRRAMVWTAAILLLAAGCGNVKTAPPAKSGPNVSTGTITIKPGEAEGNNKTEKGTAPSIKASALKGGLVAYRLDPSRHVVHRSGEPTPVSFHEHAIAEEKPVADARLAERIRQTLDDDATYGNETVMCFEPGMGFRIGEGADQADYVICLKCVKLHLFQGQKEMQAYDFSELGALNLGVIYRELFPGADKTGEAANPKDSPEAKTP